MLHVVALDDGHPDAAMVQQLLERDIERHVHVLLDAGLVNGGADQHLTITQPLIGVLLREHRSTYLEALHLRIATALLSRP